MASREIWDVPLFGNGGLETDRDLYNSKGFWEFEGVAARGGLSNIPKMVWREFGGLRGVVFFKNEVWFLLPDGRMVQERDLRQAGNISGKIVKIDAVARWIPYGTPTKEPDYFDNNQTFDAAKPAGGGWVDCDVITGYGQVSSWAFRDLPWWAIEANGGNVARGITLPSDWFDWLRKYLKQVGAFVSSSDWNNGRQGYWVEIDNTTLKRPDYRNRMVQYKGSQTGDVGSWGKDQGRNAKGLLSMYQLDYFAANLSGALDTGAYTHSPGPFDIVKDDSIYVNRGLHGIAISGASGYLAKFKFDLSRSWGDDHVGPRFVSEHVVERAIINVWPWKFIKLADYELKGFSGFEIDVMIGQVAEDIDVSGSSSSPTAVDFGGLMVVSDGVYLVEIALVLRDTNDDGMNLVFALEEGDGSNWKKVAGYSYGGYDEQGLPLVFKVQLVKDKKVRLTMAADQSGLSLIQGSKFSAFKVG